MNTRMGPRVEASAQATAVDFDLEMLEGRMLLAAGGLDPAFGVGGWATTDFTGPGWSAAEAIAIAADGKVLVAGFALTDANAGAPGGTTGAVVRFNADGSPDTTFARAGRLTVGDARVTDLLALPGGKFLAAGVRGGASFVARFNADGSPDATFAIGGYYTGRVHESDARVLLQSDGRVVLVTNFLGAQADQGIQDTDVHLDRLTAAGKPDATFGTNGGTTISLGGHEILAGAALDTLGRIVVAARYAKDGTSGDKLLLARFTRDGKPDAAFAGTGRVLGDLFRRDEIRDVAVDPLGRVLVLAADRNGVLSVARFRADGVFDRSFATRGVASAQVSATDDGSPDFARRLIALPDGSVAAVGTSADNTHNPAPRRGVVVRFTPAGAPDPTFGGGDGVQDLGPDPTFGADLALTATGRLVVAADINHHDLAAIRLTPGGAPDTTFAVAAGTPGFARAPVDAPAADSIAASAVLPDGRVVAVGSTAPGAGPASAVVVRYLSDGRLDPTFGTGGRVVLPAAVAGRSARATSVALGPNGLVLVGGLESADYSQATGFVYWLDADGHVATDFDLGVRMRSFPGAIVAVATDAQSRTLVVEQADGALALRRLDAVRDQPDPTFGGGDGRLELPGFRSSADDLLAILPDGRILVGGQYSADPATSAGGFGVYRVRPDGTIDTSFGAAGVATAFSLSPALGGNAPYALAVQPDGKVIVVGASMRYFGSDYGIARFTAAGQLDPTFGAGGTIVTNRGPSFPLDFGISTDFATEVAVAPDGTILVAGINDNPRDPTLTSGFGNSRSDIGLLRLLPDGRPDLSFGDQGWTFLAPGSGAGPSNLHVLPGGASLLVTGTATFPATGSDLALARVRLTDPAPITARIENGVLRITGSPANDTIRLIRTGATVAVTGVAGYFLANAFSRIEVTGNAGDDTIDLSAATVPATVDAGAGRDFVLGGAANDSILGGDGGDTLFGGQGNDTLDGGAGDDYLNAGPGQDAVFGGAGNDQCLATDSARDVIDLGPGYDRAAADPLDQLLNAEAPLLR